MYFTAILGLEFFSIFVSPDENLTELIQILDFLDAIASQEIPYIQVTYSQSANHLLGQISRPFRQTKDVKKGFITIIAISVIMAITVSMAITAIMGITDIRVITDNTGIRTN